MKAIFESGRPPGLLAFDGDNAVGWIQFAPRSQFPRLDTSRILKPVDDKQAWSVSCFLVHKAYRQQGLSLALLNAACEDTEKSGARIIEGYPVEPQKNPLAVQQLGSSAGYRVHDVTDVYSSRKLVESIASEIGPVTALINNAGNHVKKRVEETSFEFYLAASCC